MVGTAGLTVRNFYVLCETVTGASLTLNIGIGNGVSTKQRIWS